MATYNNGTWEDRVSDYPARRALTVVSSTGSSGLAQGDVITADVVRSEGAVTTVGSSFNKANMDALENRVKNTFATVKSVTQLFSTNATDGRKSDFALSQRCNNFDYLGVYFVAPGGQLSGYTEINAKDRTELVCSISYPNSNHDEWIIRSAYIEIPDYINMRFRRNAKIAIKTDGTHNTISTSSSETIGITRVVGYKL